MTLVIADPDLTSPELAAFRQTVLAEMSTICPATKLVLDGAGTISVQGKSGCDGYCAQRVGCNLLEAVLAPNQQLGTLTLRAGTPRYFDATHHAQPLTLYWTDAGSDVNDLVHELVHACHDYQKVFQYAWKHEELCTVCGENQVRAELGYPPRQTYSDLVVDCSNLGAHGNCQSLDSSDARGCGCGDGDWRSEAGEGGGTGVEPEPTTEPTGGRKSGESSVIAAHEPGPDVPVAWVCGCDTEITESDEWTKLGDAYVPVGLGDMTLPVAVYVRAGEDGTCRVRLVSPCTSRCTEPRSAPRDFQDCLEPFARLTRGDAPVEQMIDAANRLRCRHPVRARVSEVVERLFDTSSHFVLLERVSPLGSYGFMLLAVDGNEQTLLTNLEYRAGATMYVGRPTPVMERRLPASARDDVVVTAQRLAGLEEGVGGDPTERDAATMFLTVRRDDDVRRVAVLGYLYEGFDSSAGEEDWVRPEDVEAWRGVGEVVRLWRRAMEGAGPAGHPF